MHKLPAEFGLPEMSDFLCRGIFLHPAAQNASTERFARLLAKTVAPGDDELAGWIEA